MSTTKNIINNYEASSLARRRVPEAFIDVSSIKKNSIFYNEHGQTDERWKKQVHLLRTDQTVHVTPNEKCPKQRYYYYHHYRRAF